jgi:GNAT superfamily N-acetyltransferase
MASTKQMQARAKAKRKLQAEALIAQSVVNKFSAEAPVLSSKIQYRIVNTITDMIPIHREFCDVYRNAGDMIYGLFDNGVDVARHDRLIVKGITKWIEVYYEGQLAGFVHLGSEDLGKTYWLELMYVKPEFEGLGIATYTYKHMADYYNVKEVSLTFHRITGKCAYWVALGFTKFCLEKEEASGNRHALAKVSMYRGCPLSEDMVKTARNYLNTGKVKVSA